MSKTGVLTSVLVAAAVTLVISLSVVLGLRATPDSHSEQTRTPTPPASRFRRMCRRRRRSRRPRPSWSSVPPQPHRSRLPRHQPVPRARRAAGRADDGRCAAGSRRGPDTDPPGRMFRPRRRPRTYRPRRPRHMFRRSRKSLRCSRSRVCATRSSSAFRSSTGSTTRSRCTRRGSRDNRVVHDAESQRTQPVCITSSLRRDTVRLSRHRPERRHADTRPCLCRQAVARCSRAPLCWPCCPSRDSPPSVVAARCRQTRSPSGWRRVSRRAGSRAGVAHDGAPVSDATSPHRWSR